MPKNKRRKPTKENADFLTVAVKTLVGSLINGVIFFAVIAVCSLICWKSDANSTVFKYLVFVAGAISGFIGGYTAVKPFRKNGILIGAVSSAPVFLIIFLIASIISRTGIAASGWISALIMTLFSSIGGIMSANRRK